MVHTCSTTWKRYTDTEFIGAWNCICGYHEFYTKESKYKTVKDSAIREILEETGLHLSTDDLEFEGYDDNDNKRQNVTFSFCWCTC